MLLQRQGKNIKMENNKDSFIVYYCKRCGRKYSFPKEESNVGKNAIGIATLATIGVGMISVNRAPRCDYCDRLLKKYNGENIVFKKDLKRPWFVRLMETQDEKEYFEQMRKEENAKS